MAGAHVCDTLGEAEQRNSIFVRFLAACLPSLGHIPQINRLLSEFKRGVPPVVNITLGHLLIGQSAA